MARRNAGSMLPGCTLSPSRPHVVIVVLRSGSGLIMAKRKSVDSVKTAPIKANKRRRSTDKATSHTMPPGTAIQENLVKSNEDYASSFTKGDLALPPAKHYAVGEFYTGPIPAAL